MINNETGRAHVTAIICDIRHIIDIGVVYVYYKYCNWVISCTKRMKNGDDIVLKAQVDNGFVAYKTIFFKDLEEMILNKKGLLSSEEIANLQATLDRNVMLFKNKILTFKEVSDLMKYCFHYDALLNDGLSDLTEDTAFYAFITNRIEEFILNLIGVGLPDLNKDGASLYIMNTNIKPYDTVCQIIKNSDSDSIKKMTIITPDEIDGVLNGVDELIYISHDLSHINQVVDDINKDKSELKTVSIVIPLRYAKNTTKLISNTIPEIVGLYYL